MNFFEQEMRKFFSDSDVISDQKYVGKTMLGRLDDDLRVKLQFVTGIAANQYNGIRAQIINRTEGQIDSQVFRFSDILGPDPVMSKPGNNAQIHIWDGYGEPDWYGYHPSPAAVEKVADTINGYLSMYQSEDMTMSM